MTITPKANLQLVYVSDISRSTAFTKKFLSLLQYFQVLVMLLLLQNANSEVLFAIWTGADMPDVDVHS